MICDLWQVAIVPFPFVNSSAAKRRPALAISNRRFNLANGHTVLSMITTAGSTAWPSDHPIAEPGAAGLHRNCFVRWKIFTLPNGLILGIAGALGQSDRQAVLQSAGAILFND